MKMTPLAFFVVLASCASQIMEGFVGKDVTEVALQYGPPLAAFDMPDGRKAFQWRMDSAYTMPSTTTYTGVASGNLITGTAQTYGGGVQTNACFYTLFAEPNKNNSYTVVGFQKPRLDCE